MRIFWVCFSIVLVGKPHLLEAQTISFKSPTEQVEISHRTLNYTLIRYTYPNMTSSVPNGSENRIVFKNKEISAKQQRELRKILQHSDFFTFPATSGASAKERNYPETLTIYWKNKKHTLLHRSNPSYPPPAGYDKLKSELFNWIDNIEQTDKKSPVVK